MAVESVRIEELHLRVPGLSREEGRRLGEEVARLLARELPDAARPQHLGTLDLRVSIPPGTPRDRLAEVIVRAVRKGLA